MPFLLFPDSDVNNVSWEKVRFLDSFLILSLIMNSSYFFVNKMTAGGRRRGLRRYRRPTFRQQFRPRFRCQGTCLPCGQILGSFCFFLFFMRFFLSSGLLFFCFS